MLFLQAGGGHFQYPLASVFSVIFTSTLLTKVLHFLFRGGAWCFYTPKKGKNSGLADITSHWGNINEKYKLYLFNAGFSI